MVSVSEVAVASRVTAATLILRARERISRSDPMAAKDLALQAEHLARDDDDRAAQAEALAVVAMCWRLRDEYDQAFPAALRAAELSRDLDEPAVQARSRSEVARVLQATGETSEALQESLAALELAEASGDLDAFVVVLTTVANVYLALQQFDLAIQMCERAAETARLIGDEIANAALLDTAACALIGVAYKARAEGDEKAAVEAALAAAERSRTAMLIARRCGHRRNEAAAVANLAEELAFAGYSERALALLESWPTDPERDSRYTLTHHLDTRGCILMAMGRFDEAIEFFTRALDLAESKGAAMMSCEHLAEAQEGNGDVTGALASYKQFHLLYVQVASEAAQRNARVAAVRMETEQAKGQAEQQRQRADGLLRMSLEDPLTGLANRRRLDDLLSTDAGSYAVALIDVDHFKRVNDQFSHQVGDEVLRQLAVLLRAGCRAADVAARYGGEEFAVLFHGLSGPEAAAAAERIRRTVETYAWETIAKGLSVTVSAGVAAGGLLPVADKRLYAAKHAGRNRVIGAGS
jgi:diguanylate cyclase (GGDEF)-like protein